MREPPTEQEIAAALAASGFLMEQEVATAFEEAGFHATTGRAYTDPEEGKSRELDVYGFLRHMQDDSRRAAVYVRLLCECKNTSNPFVFLARRKTEADLRRNPEEYLFPMRHVAVSIGSSTRYDAPFHHLGLGDSHYRFQDPVKAVQIVRMDHPQRQWVAENTSVFTSLLYPLAKALRAFQKEHRYAAEALPAGSLVATLRQLPAASHSATANLYFPMVVVRSPLWVVDVQRSAVDPKRVRFVTLERELKSEVISGRFAIDFVEQGYVGEYLARNVRPFASAVERALWPDGDDARP
jgi:hypothetical protein